MGRINSYRDLTAWKRAHQLVLSVYQLSQRFPDSEIFGLTSQMRRCAVSVVSNIIEGFSRQGTKEKIQFYYYAKSSLVELQGQLEIAKDLNFLTKDKYDDIEILIVESQKMISGLIKSIRR